jgi:hypothetical protein
MQHDRQSSGTKANDLKIKIFSIDSREIRHSTLNRRSTSVSIVQAKGRMGIV